MTYIGLFFMLLSIGIILEFKVVPLLTEIVKELKAIKIFLRARRSK